MSAGRIPSALHYARMVGAPALCLLVASLALLIWGRNKSHPTTRGTWPRAGTRNTSGVSRRSPRARTRTEDGTRPPRPGGYP